MEAENHKEDSDSDEFSRRCISLPARGRKRKFTDTERIERKRLSDKKRAERRLRISNDDIDRWNNLKAQLGLRNHPDMATFLLNWFDLTSPHPALASDVHQLLNSSYPRQAAVSETDTTMSVQYDEGGAAKEGVGSSGEPTPVAVFPHIEILNPKTTYHRIPPEEQIEESGSSDASDASESQSDGSEDIDPRTGELCKSAKPSQDLSTAKEDCHRGVLTDAGSARPRQAMRKQEKSSIRRKSPAVESDDSERCGEWEEPASAASPAIRLDGDDGPSGRASPQTETSSGPGSPEAQSSHGETETSEGKAAAPAEDVCSRPDEPEAVTASGRPRRKASLGINSLLLPWWKREEFGGAVGSTNTSRRTKALKNYRKPPKKLAVEHNYAFGSMEGSAVVKREKNVEQMREVTYEDVFDSSSDEDIDDEDDKDFLPEEEEKSWKRKKGGVKVDRVEEDDVFEGDSEAEESDEHEKEQDADALGDVLTEEEIANQLQAYEDHIKRMPNGLDACRLCNCKFKTRTRKNLLRHFMLHEEGELSCPDCSFVAATKSGLISHKLSHGPKGFICDQCGYATYTNKALELHKIRSHTPESEKSLVCTWEDCSRRFALKCDYKKHLNTHKNPGGYVCHVCGKEFCSMRSLHIHIKNVHEKDSEEAKIVCELCGKQYAPSSRHIFKMHMRTHNNEKPFKCQFCGKGFVSGQLLKDHERTHTGEKPFKCMHCDFRAAKRAQVHSHVKTHTGVKPFKCKICQYASTWNIQLKTHMKAHGSPTQVFCVLCDVAFINQKSLNIHNKKLHYGKNNQYFSEGVPIL